MAGNQNINSKDKPGEISVVRELLALEKEKLSYQKDRLSLEKMHLKNHAEIAKQSIDTQKDLLSKAPGERRKDRSQIFWFSLVALVIIFSFCFLCLVYNYETFLKWFFGIVSHLVTLYIGYYFGTKKNQSEQRLGDDLFADAEILEEDS